MPFDPKEFFSKTSLSVAGIVVLVAGLYLAVLGSQQQQQTESQASGLSVGDTVPGTPITIQGKNAAGNGSDSHTIMGLTVGVQYKIVVSGIIYYQKPTARAYDPQYTDLGNTAGCFCVRGVPLGFNGATLSSEETSFQPSHTYTFLWVADKTSLEVSANDAPNYYYDNEGSFTLKMTVNALPNTSPPETDQGVKLALDLLLHGIGKAGDSVRPGVPGGGNADPLHKERKVKVTLYNDQDQLVKTVEGTVIYASDSGSFKGLVPVGAIAAGDYLVKVKFTQSLDEQISGIVTITGGTVVVAQDALVTGDINNDGAVSLNVLDFNKLVGCIRGLAACATFDKEQSDLSDNGKLDQFDFNLFIREITHVTN